MVITWVYTAIIAISVAAAIFTGNGSALSAAAAGGTKAGIDLAITLAGSICLWTGAGTLMEKVGLTGMLSRLFRPVLYRIFPSTKTDDALASSLSANICANFLGLGNAATPMGIRSAKRLVDPDRPGVATGQLCRLVVLNTASIQLIPATVAAVRASLGSAAPFAILPAVWVTSFCSAGLGVAAAWLLGKLWGHD